MPSTYSSNLRLNLQADGENDSSWGDISNVNLRLLEDSISGLVTINTTGGDTTLTTNNGSSSYGSSSDQARGAILKITGTLVSNANIIVPAATKIYAVVNATSGAHTVTVKVAASTGVAVTQGKNTLLYCDASEVYSVFTDAGAAGDFSSSVSVSVDNEVVLFSSTTGKVAKRASTTGIAKLTSGVLSAAVAGTDYIAGVITLNNQAVNTYTLQATDLNEYVRLNYATAITCTVPAYSGVPFAVGSQVHIRQVGLGQVTLVGAGGVTINTPLTLKLRAQNSTVTLINVATDVWDVMGDLATS